MSTPGNRSWTRPSGLPVVSRWAPRRTASVRALHVNADAGAYAGLALGVQVMLD